MRPNLLALAGGVMASALVGCAAARSVTIEGESRGRALDIHVSGQVDGAAARVTLDFTNHDHDAVGVELDEIRLVDADGESYPPLGRAQTFRARGGEKTVRRVPHGTTTISPGTQHAVEIEFEKLPPGRSYALAVPTLYRLGIDGQENMPPIKLPLHPDARSEASLASQSPTGPDAWFDPFVEW